MPKSGNTEAEHIIKQKKKKGLPNTKVYGSLNGVVEMHDIGDYEIEDKAIKERFKDLTEENIKLNKRLDNAKTALTTMSNKMEIIERKLKTYGLE